VATIAAVFVPESRAEFKGDFQRPDGGGSYGGKVEQEVDYLQQVGCVTAAAAAIKANTFELECLDGVARRPDELGQLAQVFQDMARQIYAREQQLKQQVQQLRIEIDQARKAREVAEITESDYFQQLLSKADELRNRIKDEEMS